MEGVAHRVEVGEVQKPRVRLLFESKTSTASSFEKGKERTT